MGALWFLAPENRVFMVIWLGQLVSVVGTYCCAFCLRVWIWQTTNSVTDFALSTFFSDVPALLVSPLAGVVVDKFNKKTIMVVGDLAAVASTVFISLIVWTDSTLQVWHLYAATATNSIFGAFQGPALTASITTLVPPKYYAQASGLFSTAEGVSQLLSPALAGMLYGLTGLKGALLVDLITCGFAVGSLLIVRFPNRADSVSSLPDGSEPTTPKTGRIHKWFAEASVGWRFIRRRPGLLGSLLLFAVSSFTSSYIFELIPPLMLSITSTEVFGIVSSASGSGFLFGSVAVAMWGTPSNRVKTIVVMLMLQGATMLSAVFHPTSWLIGSVGFVYLFLEPFINACSMSLWQSKVPVNVQGRVFSVKRMIAVGISPLGLLSAGPLADRVFEPLMSINGPMQGTWLATLMGLGPGRGISLLFVVLGLVLISTAIITFCVPRVMNIERELPDAVVKSK